eukprot:1414613-Amphidinium_carterae.1
MSERQCRTNVTLEGSSPFVMTQCVDTLDGDFTRYCPIVPCEWNSFSSSEVEIGSLPHSTEQRRLSEDISPRVTKYHAVLP